MSDAMALKINADKALLECLELNNDKNFKQRMEDIVYFKVYMLLSEFELDALDKQMNCQAREFVNKLIK